MALNECTFSMTANENYCDFFVSYISTFLSYTQMSKRCNCNEKRGDVDVVTSLLPTHSSVVVMSSFPCVFGGDHSVLHSILEVPLLEKIPLLPIVWTVLSSLPPVSPTYLLLLLSLL
jgi:hypothetical protein